jgi:hypothetical protein
VVPQLNFIGAALRDGAGERMQTLFPEGFFFSHVLYGMAWTQVGMRQKVADALHDQALADPLLHASEAFGLPISWAGSKRYLFGAVPVGDAFLVWSKSALFWYDVPIPSPWPPVVRWWWRLPTHALSLALVALFWLPFRRKRRTLGEETSRPDM